MTDHSPIHPAIQTSVTEASFALHPRLEQDSLPVAIHEKCEVRLINDQRFLWALVVPRCPGVQELHELEPEMRQNAWNLVQVLSAGIALLPEIDKINVGMLGNLVPQLHIHVVGRRQDDPAWPGPVWGSGEAVAYGISDAEERVLFLKGLLTDLCAETSTSS